MTDLRIADLHVSLDARPILRGINLGFGGGGLVGLIGPNGAGKSTLVRTIVRLIRPKAGRVLIDGRELAAYSKRALARKVAYLPQGHSIHWPLDVRALVSLGRLPHAPPLGRPSRHDAAAVDLALARTQTQAFSGRVATTLSGGERARVMLARALAMEAPILLVDEPIVSLDPAHQLQIMELLREIAREGRLVVAVLHDLPLAARFCARLILLDQGCVIADGPPQEVLARAHLEAVYGVEGLYGEVERERYVLPWRRLRLSPDDPEGPAHAQGA